MTIINSSKVNTGLPLLPDGVPQDLFSYFQQLYNAIHNLERLVSQYAGVDELPSDWWSQISMDETIFSGNMNRLYVKAYENLTFGNIISPILDGGELKVRKANATDNTKPAIGFVTNTTGASAGGFCEVQLGVGLVTGVSGMTTANRYFLSTTSGVITNSAPVAAGNIEQVVGFALASNRLFMNLTGAWIQH